MEKEKDFTTEDILNFLAGDIPPNPELNFYLEKISRQKPATFYSDLLRQLTSEQFSEEQAKKLFSEIVRNKYIMSEKLGRNVGIRVAALDYLENILGIIKSPVIIEQEDFDRTIKQLRLDPLTGIYNRRYLYQRLNEELLRASTEKYPLSVGLLDLDHFKDYNDRYGHQAGDILLQEIATILRRAIVEKKILMARYGGDEFVIIFPRLDKLAAKKIAEEIQHELAKTLNEFGITISVGIAQFPEDSQEATTLIELADEALYSAKEFGRNRVVIHRTINFTYQPAPEMTVNQVSVVGDFNNWNARRGIMRLAEGKWQTKVLLRPGTYRYKFFLNNSVWIPDPQNPLTTDDGFGGQCSVLKVEM